MRGKLDAQQIDNLLLSQSIGHLGCTSSNKPYVVPITYLFDEDNIYCQTWPGLKLTTMRNNPLVCFEVYRHTDMFNWESAVVWGQFEELSDEEAFDARTPLFEHVFQLMTPAVTHAHEHTDMLIVNDENRYKPIMFRIKITEKTGCFRNTRSSL
jgi:nitroimidazol reductase NimA-like FMN-containing flavoprotein (pyridoxamine 5'-phosphate oxidase superfamily)